MRYLKPNGTPIKLIVIKEVKGHLEKKEQEFHLLYTLEVIDELQVKTGISIDEIITYLTIDKLKEKAVKCLFKYLTGEEIEINDLDYYSILLIKTYIDQLQPKEIGKRVIKDPEGFSFFDVEHWFYIGKVVLEYPEDEVWKMTPGKIATLYHEHAKFNKWIENETEAKKENVISF